MLKCSIFNCLSKVHHDLSFSYAYTGDSCLGLVFLEFSADGLLDFTHTLATTITMCKRIERRYRLKLQQMLYLPVIHQGDTTKRLHAKKCYRNIAEKNEADQRVESIQGAFDLTNDRVRNLWVNLAHKAWMFSKFSAASYDTDSDEADEAILNVSLLTHLLFRAKFIFSKPGRLKPCI